MSAKEMKFTVAGYECSVCPEMLSIRIGIDGFEYRVFFKEQNGKQVVSRIIPEPESQAKGKLLGHVVDKYWEERVGIEKENNHNWSSAAEAIPIFSSFMIKEKEVLVGTTEMCGNSTFIIKIDGKTYKTYSERSYDRERPLKSRNGICLYLNSTETSDGEISDEVLEIISQAVLAHEKMADSNGFIEFR